MPSIESTFGSEMPPLNTWVVISAKSSEIVCIIKCKQGESHFTSNRIMAEYAAGQEVSALNASTDTGSVETDVSALMQAREAKSIEATAANLTARNKNTFGVGGDATDANSLAMEAKLQETQNELSRLRNNGGSFLQIAQKEALAQQLAERLVTGNVGGDPVLNQDTDLSVDQSDDVPESFSAAAELKGKYSSSVVDSTLQWAANTLSESVSESFNNAMAADDEQAFAAFEQIRQIQQHPEIIASEEEFSQITPQQVNELESQLGPAGKQLGLLSFGIASGRLTRAQALEAIMRDQNLQIAAMQGARMGLLKLAL